eukprot:5195973-Pyramimonas_sp.AAC.1
MYSDCCADVRCCSTSLLCKMSPACAGSAVHVSRDAKSRPFPRSGTWNGSDLKAAPNCCCGAKAACS